MKNENINPNAICGNCGKPYKDHYFEDSIYCFDNTNGDVWDDDPSDDDIVEYLENKFPEVYKLIVKRWKEENGHGEP